MSFALAVAVAELKEKLAEASPCLGDAHATGCNLLHSAAILQYAFFKLRSSGVSVRSFAHSQSAKQRRLFFCKSFHDQHRTDSWFVTVARGLWYVVERQGMCADTHEQAC